MWQLEGLNERLRFLRYEPGEKFEPHLDGSFVRTDGDKAGDRSFVTVLLYLNTGTGVCARERAAGVPRGGLTFTTASQETRQQFVICTHTRNTPSHVPTDPAGDYDLLVVEEICVDLWRRV